ncbi:indolepyruvate oxidoreductase subunit beta [Desulfovibrio litoralis]|uniref:Indolepyruvate ferredoxin oxidoreductase beta subunit n=1 Tax=Desulfovibrio litoralis DSM 11393 TaxID=1121455 RepID=A0A1M7RZA3_9BACT|nr:indolepyruvate oxidoreductase subunit beta [Desulfovibrio litoralis]SHN51677.1 indolepyruvate ferredoxin oxidoreductase beta subunit [Desulfovibrio litoralis DSM 11393]
MSAKIRILLTGVGGQGTLTATTLLARAALLENLEVVSGEIHGMAQRGGVVESTVLIGGWKSPKIDLGEADLILGFEPLETLRALPYLKKNGLVLSSTEFIPAPSVALGQEENPSLEEIKNKVKEVASKAWYLDCRSIGLKLGAVQSGNLALLAAATATGALPFNSDTLKKVVEKYLPAKIVETNLKAIDFGVKAIQ